MKIAVAYNLAGGSTDSAQTSFIGQFVTTDANLVFANWSPDVQTELAATSMPEPASLFLLGTGLAAASASGRRRRAVAE